MASGFGKRLKAAMLAAGMDTPTRLARACNVSRQTVVNWLAMDTAELSAESLYGIAVCLGVRMHWLVSGQGASEVTLMRRLVAILDTLNPEQAEEWLKSGERMAG